MPFLLYDPIMATEYCGYYCINKEYDGDVRVPS